MLFSETRWIRSNIKKLDIPLRKELLNIYKHRKHSICFLNNLINKIRYNLRKFNVIIRFDNDSSPESLVRNKDTRNIKIKKSSVFKSMNLYGARLTPKKINALLEADSVSNIYLDRKYKALMDIASPSLKASFAWNMGLSGKGITTAVVDTGIYPHEDLIKPINRILAFKDFVGRKSKPYDDNGHGTHVAGDIAANGHSSQGKYKAPAYESNLVGVKVLNKYGSGNLSTIISGIEWCIENKDTYGIRIICLSLGAEAQSSYKDDILCEAVEKAWKSGIVVCAAAGNDGPALSTIDSPGIDPLIITVGAAGDENTPDRSNDIIAPFSSRGPTKVDNLPKPDVICPGVNIISLRSPGSYSDKTSKSSRVDNYYTNMSGTSMATPLCCSCIALLLQKNPSLTPDQVKEIITGSAEDIGYDRNAQGYGYIDIEGIFHFTTLSKN